MFVGVSPPGLGARSSEVTFFGGSAGNSAETLGYSWIHCRITNRRPSTEAGWILSSGLRSFQGLRRGNLNI